MEGPDTDWIHLPDPIADAIKELSGRIAELEKQLAEARGERDKQAEVTELRRKQGPSSAGG
jgi:serine O-acetyltransferase